MPTTVEIPGYGEVEFPDTMSEDEISAAAKRLHEQGGAPRGSAAAAFGSGAAQGATLDFGDEISGAIQAALPMPGERGDFGERYKRWRESARLEDERAKAEHPGWYGFGNVAGGVAPTLLVPAGKVARGAKLLSRIGQGARVGAPVGAAYGLGGSTADTWEGLATDALTGGVAGGAVGGAVSAIGAGLRGLLRLPAKLLSVTPTAEARQLLSEGVPLTAGQRNPASTLGQIEAVSTHNPLGVQGQREAAKAGWRSNVLMKTQPKGAQPLPADMESAMAEAYQRFGQEYDAIREIPIDPDTLRSLPRAAVEMPKGIDARTRAGVKAEVENALTVLGDKFPQRPPTQGHGHGGAAETAATLVDPYGRPVPTAAAPEVPVEVTAGDLMKVRENIRRQKRLAGKARDYDRRNLLGHAEDVVTSRLEANLPEGAAEQLKNIDRRYAKLMTIESAPFIGQVDFTPAQLARAVEGSAGRRAFKQGAAGELQDTAEAARKVFEDAPLTGFRGAVLGSVPGMRYLAAPISHLSNRLNPPFEVPLRLESPFREGVRRRASTAAAVYGSPEVAAMLRVLRQRSGLLPAGAEEDRAP